MVKAARRKAREEEIQRHGKLISTRPARIKQRKRREKFVEEEF